MMKTFSIFVLLAALVFLGEVVPAVPMPYLPGGLIGLTTAEVANMGKSTASNNGNGNGNSRVNSHSAGVSASGQFKGRQVGPPPPQPKGRGR